MPGVQEHTSELQSHDNLVCLEFRRVLLDRKSTRLNSSHTIISYAVFCLKKEEAETVRAVVGALRGHVNHLLAPVAHGGHMDIIAVTPWTICSRGPATDSSFFFFLAPGHPQISTIFPGGSVSY